MYVHMRTSIEIPDPLLRRARSVARKRNTTLRAILLEGLRRVVEQQSSDPKTYELRDESFGRGGLVEGLSATDWEQIRERVYEGRGG